MPQFKQFPLPDVGEGLTEAEILTWHVKPGDTVSVNQIIVEIETAKAAVELPCPWSGVITELLVQPGETVDVGRPIVTIDIDPGGAAAPSDGGGGAAAPASSAAGASSAGTDSTQGKIGEEMPGGRIATLVGYGPRSATAKRRPRKGAASAGAASAGAASAGAASAGAASAGPASAGPASAGAASAPAADQPPAPAVPAGQSAAAAQRAVQTSAERAPEPTPKAAAARTAEVAEAAPSPTASDVARMADVAEAAPSPTASDAARMADVAGAVAPPAVEPSANGAGGYVPLAKPPVRKLAKELGVDLRALAGSGPAGVITREDVHRAATTPLDEAQPVAALAGEPSVEAASYDPATRERRMPIRGVRRATAAAVVQSAFSAPHVTEFITVDVTPMMELRSRLKDSAAFAGVKITPLSFAAKAVCLAVRRTPDVNATWDEEAGEIVYKDYVHLGIAAATPRGLIVPKVRDADRMSLRELAEALEALANTAREGRTPPGDMVGGTITITNVGVFGVDTGTPIINPGESAILALGAIRDLPWVVDGQVVPRKVCQLALSFDHRLIDGQQGSQFLADVAAILADPAVAITF